MKYKANFPKSISLGGYTKKELIDELFKIYCEIPAAALSIILSDWFTVCPEIKEVRLQRKTVAEMGFISKMTTWKEIKAWIELNGELGDFELALRLRLAYRDQPIDEELYIANNFEYFRVANINGIQSISRDKSDGFITNSEGEYSGGEEDMVYCSSDEFVYYEKLKGSKKLLNVVKKLIK